MVQFYETDAFLAVSVADFAATAMAVGDPAIVVATESHRRLIAEALERAGNGDSAGTSDGVTWLDAQETLDSFMVDGSPDPARFDEVIGTLVRSHLDRGRLSIYGEMVSLLFDEGNVTAAMKLEDLWRELLKSSSFVLLCAYPLAGFWKEGSESLFEVCERHTTLVPGETPIDAHLVEDLGGPVEKEDRSLARMEPLGQVAGGIAHDLNNVLAVMLNYTAFVEDALERGDERSLRDARADIKQVSGAAKRAVSITRGLLKLSCREVVDPQAPGPGVPIGVRDAEGSI
jgi:signal transduction histidine kinase